MTAEAVNDNRKRRRPLPAEGYLWAASHRLRGHRVYRHGWSISHGGSRRCWMCGTCYTGTGTVERGVAGQWPS